MADTYQSYIAKINSCDKNFFGFKRTKKKTIAILKILKSKITNEKNLTITNKSILLRMISKRMVVL